MRAVIAIAVLAIVGGLAWFFTSSVGPDDLLLQIEEARAAACSAQTRAEAQVHVDWFSEYAAPTFNDVRDDMTTEQRETYAAAIRSTFECAQELPEG